MWYGYCMRRMTDQLKSKILSDPLAAKCFRYLALRDHECEGRITLEHAILYAGRQVNEAWAVVPICAKAHSVDAWQDTGILDKRINEWIAINRMKKEDEVKYGRVDWQQKRRYLNGVYGAMELHTTLS